MFTIQIGAKETKYLNFCQLEMQILEYKIYII